MAIRILATLLVCCLAAVAQTTYYAKNGGSDAADGLSDANAWATIGKVNATAATGDTVLLHSGHTFNARLRLTANDITVGIYNGTAIASIQDPTNQGFVSDAVTGTTISDVEFVGPTNADAALFNGAGSATFIRCRFTANKDGVQVDANGASVTLVDCEMSSCGNSGLLLNADATVDLAGGLIAGNGNHGLLAYGNSAVATIRRTTIRDNVGSGLFWDPPADAGSTLTMTSCVLRIRQSGWATNDSCIRTDGGTVVVDGCTLDVDVAATNNVYGILLGANTASANVTNCAFRAHATDGNTYNAYVVSVGVVGTWDHNRYQDASTSSFRSTAVQTFAAWQAATGADANSSEVADLLLTGTDLADPLNARPTAGSPLIDAGNDYAWSSTEDYEGIARTGVRDVGAFAITVLPAAPPVDLASIAPWRGEDIRWHTELSVVGIAGAITTSAQIVNLVGHLPDPDQATGGGHRLILSAPPGTAFTLALGFDGYAPGLSARQQVAYVIDDEPLDIRTSRMITSFEILGPAASTFAATLYR